MMKRGWPDFIAVKGSEVRFIEVKRPPHPHLKPEQKRVAEILRRFGMRWKYGLHKGLRFSFWLSRLGLGLHGAPRKTRHAGFRDGNRPSSFWGVFLFSALSFPFTLSCYLQVNQQVLKGTTPLGRNAKAFLMGDGPFVRGPGPCIFQPKLLHKLCTGKEP